MWANARSLLVATTILIATTAVPLLAQPNAAGAVVDTAMAPLTWLVGEWEGTGFMQTPQGRQGAAVTERVESRLDGRVLIFEGIGRERAPDGTAGPVVHHALGVLTFDPDNARYAFRAYRDGQLMDPEASLADGIFTWSFTVPGGRVRYRLWTDSGEWLETGELSSDGATWRPFFEMRLRRTASGR